MPIRLRALLGAAALLAVVLPCGGCRADRSTRGATAAPPIGRVLAIQSAHPDAPIALVALPTEIVPIPDQEVRRLPAAGSQTNTLRETWFDAFEPGVHVACLADGTIAVELAWPVNSPDATAPSLRPCPTSATAAPPRPAPARSSA